MNKYLQYKDSGIPEIGNVPEHWKKDKIARIVEFSASGGTPTSNNESYYNGNIVWVQTGELNDTDIFDTEKKLTEEGYAASSAKKFQPDTLLIAMYGATIGKLGILKVEAATNQACCALYFKKGKWNTKYFFYYFLSIREKLIRNSYGGGQSNINQEVIKQETLFLPGLDEQTAIANYLDQATAKIDSVISLKQQQLAKLEQYRKSKIHECVTKGVNPKAPMKDSGIEWIGLVPEHWKVEKLKYLTSLIIDGTHFTPNYLDNEDGIPFFRVTDIQTDEIEYSRLKKISQEEYIELNRRCNPEKGDLLLSKNGTIGITKVVTWDYPFSLFVSLCLIKPLEKLNVNFLDYLFKCGFFEQQISDSSKATTVTNLHLEMIKDFSLLKPPIIEQSEIVAHLDSFLESFKLEKSIIEQQILKLQQYRKSLIHECVTGKRKIA